MRRLTLLILIIISMNVLLNNEDRVAIGNYSPSQNCYGAALGVSTIRGGEHLD